MIFGGIFDFEKSHLRYKELEVKIAETDFWEKAESTRNKVFDELRDLKSLLDPWLNEKKRLDDLETLYELAIEENDNDTFQEINSELNEAEKELKKLRLSSIFASEDDKRNAFLSIQAGAGGIDACDWAEMLMRMYTRFAEQKGFGCKIIALQQEEEGGIKSATLHLKGHCCHGYMKAENGIHRLVRISPYDSGGRRHTSFAAVDIVPEFEDPPEVEIDEKKDLNIDRYRASGAGGQHVNVTDSAVRLTHLPTGLVVCCQNERSQHKNKATALKILKTRLYQKEVKEREETLNKQYGNKAQVSWSNQIRSYVLHPYTLVKDHRTDYEKGNAQGVLDGDIEEFIEAYLHHTSSQEIG